MKNIYVKLAFNFCDSEIEYYRWQKYFMIGFRALEGVKFKITPFSSKMLARALRSRSRYRKFWMKLSPFLKKKGRVEGNHVGRYIINIDGKETKVVIDASDGGGIRCEEAYEWADLHFKSNMWANIQYKEKVLPITTGSISLSQKDIEYLKTLRGHKEKYDISFISRIWLGSEFSNDRFAMVEHQIRLFETLSSIDCSKYLKAIIAKELPYETMKPYLQRLDKAGVPWSYKMVPVSEIWEVTKRSRMVFFRPGKYLAMPGRMLEYLAMGACVVFDTKPHTQWVVPLIEDINYFACDSGLNLDESLPAIENYSNIKTVIENKLSDAREINIIKKNNAQYFDDYASPEKVAEYVLNTVKNYKLR